jgi:hypothetical protein
VFVNELCHLSPDEAAESAVSQGGQIMRSKGRVHAT